MAKETRDSGSAAATVEQPSTETQQQTNGGLVERTPVTIGQAPPPPSKVPVRMGLAPQSVDEAWRLAQYIASSELVPKDFRGKPYNVLIAIELGMEVGVPWAAAVQGTAVINGRPGFFGDVFLGVITSTATFKDMDEYYEVPVKETVSEGGKTIERWVMERRDGLRADDWKNEDTAAVCTFWRTDRARPITRRFSVGQAKKAGLLGKTGPWQDYPDRQLQMRARGFAGRDGFSERLKGIKSVEELHDYPEPEVIEVPREVRRISQTAPATTDPAAPAAAPKVEMPKAEDLTLDPQTVKGVEQFLGGFTITLGNGLQVDTTEVNDAAELEKFVGTKHKVRLSVKKVQDRMELTSFAIAD